MPVMNDKVRAFGLIAGLTAAIIACCCLRAGLVAGAVLLLLALLVVGTTQANMISRCRADRFLQQPPQWLLVVGGTIAILGCAYGCFSFIAGYRGFHYDVAEFGMVLRSAASTLQAKDAPKMRLFLQQPHHVMVASLTNWLGFGL